MTDTASTDLAIPGTGELVNLDDHRSCARALASLRYLESEFREAKAILTRAIAEEAARQGTKTLELEDGRKAVVSGGSEMEYDAEALEQGLRDAGMPEFRIREVVEETVTYKVKAVEAKRAAGANPAYEAVVERCRRTVEKPFVVSIRRS